MNEELMHDANFIHCSIVIANLLLKYKEQNEQIEYSKYSKTGKERESARILSFFAFAIANSRVFVYNIYWSDIPLIKYDRRLLRMSNAYMYTRVSSVIQVDGFSLDAQDEEIRAFAKQRNINIVGKYSDEGKSGKMRNTDLRLSG